jgi:uncharacterized protein YciI
MRSDGLPDGVGVESVFLLEVPYTPEAPQRRPAVRPGHLRRVAELHAAGTIIEAGGCLDWSKAMLLVRAPDAAAALRIAEEDVYTADGVWRSPTAVPFGRITFDGPAPSTADAPRPTDDIQAVTAELLELELALARRDAARIEGGFEALLDDDFEEVGSSGRRWGRGATVDLIDAPGVGSLEIEGFRVAQLAVGVVLVTYDTVAPRPDGPIARVRRCSIWVRRGDRWRMRYHHGTRSDQT